MVALTWHLHWWISATQGSRDDHYSSIDMCRPWRGLVCLQLPGHGINDKLQHSNATPESTNRLERLDTTPVKDETSLKVIL